MHILLIEPDTVLSKIYAQAFKRHGNTVTSVRNAQSAISAADEKLPDVVVLELQLAAHSGAAFLYEFRSYTDWIRVPIIIHTLTPPDRLEPYATTFAELGVFATLYKPATSLARLYETAQDAAAIKI